MNKRGGLGRGLAALIPTSPPPAAAAAPAEAVEPDVTPAGGESAEVSPAPSSGSAPTVTLVPPPAPTPLFGSPAASQVVEGALGVPGAQLREVSVDDVVPNPKQPRQVFDDEALEELTHSVKEFGLLQPIVVREKPDGGYELIMGERRLRAARAAELETVPAIVRDTTDDALLRDALLENIHRVQLNPLEEAAAYQQLLEEFGATQEELSRRIGRSRPQISNTIRLLRLPPLVQRRVAAGVLSSGHARALLSLADPAQMERLAQRIVAEGLSVRATEEAVQLTETGERKPQRAAAPAGRNKERLDYIAEAFSDRLDTSVRIALGARKGKMTIEFASVEDLNRIIEVLDPGMDRT
jgi:ParB family chromosome partitioning protein